MIKIYHNKEFILLGYALMGMKMDAENAEKAMLKPENLVKVAEMVEVSLNTLESLEHAFKMTQSIDASWTRNFKVKGFVPAVQLGTAISHKLRSTSVGDVLELNDKFYLIDLEGMTEIGNPFEEFGSIFDELDPETGMYIN